RFYQGKESMHYLRARCPGNNLSVVGIDSISVGKVCDRALHHISANSAHSSIGMGVAVIAEFYVTRFEFGDKHRHDTAIGILERCFNEAPRTCRLDPEGL